MSAAEYKLIVAGGREFADYSKAEEAILSLTTGPLKGRAISIVSGMAKGADAMGMAFAKAHNLKLHEFPANWEAFGRRAGPKRNAEMADFADGLLAFWDGESRGTKNMIDTMKGLGKSVRVIKYGRAE